MNQVEFALKVLPFDDALSEKLAALAAEGWQSIPGLTPTATYVMFRNVPAQQPTSEGHGGITIDDSKVHVIKGG